jgi:hypothetical protein
MNLKFEEYETLNRISLCYPVLNSIICKITIHLIILRDIEG